jgi:hypothetical protein
MMWVDYFIESLDNGTWRVEKEAVDKGLYKEGDVFIVKNGWLVKQEELTSLIIKKDSEKNEV